MLTLIFAGVIASIVKESFPLFRYSIVVFTSFYIVLSFSHPDYWIAKVNLASTEETRSEFFKGEAYEDYVLLSELNADAAPVLVNWIKEEGYYLDSYDVDTMTYEAFLILNEAKISNEKQTVEETLRDQKAWCAYDYLRQLGKDCRDIGLREFNVSRFLANYEVLH